MTPATRGKGVVSENRVDSTVSSPQEYAALQAGFRRTKHVHLPHNPEEMADDFVKLATLGESRYFRINILEKCVSTRCGVAPFSHHVGAPLSILPPFPAFFFGFLIFLRNGPPPPTPPHTPRTMI